MAGKLKLLLFMFCLLHSAACSNEELVSNVLKASGRVATAMLQTDRAKYCLAGTRPYDNAPQRISADATISQPYMHKVSLDVLQQYLVARAKTGGQVAVLDVGCGSGYLLAAFSRLLVLSSLDCHKIVGVEIDSALVDMSRRNLAGDGFQKMLNDRKIQVHHSGHGWGQEGPYDYIHVGASCKQEPAELFAQLKPDGWILYPFGDEDAPQAMRLKRKTSAGMSDVEGFESIGVRYVPYQEGV